MTHAVALKNIRKRFGSVEVLRGVDLEVARGKTLCVLGPSGSGKSTLLRCVNFLEQPDEGTVHLAGERVGYIESKNGVRPMKPRELALMRTRMGMVFQHFNLWSHLTVLGNLIEAPVHVQGRSRDEAIAVAEALLAKVGLQNKRDEYPSRLSGGQKQRVAIARALATKPEVLLFDEPTSSLDPELVGEVLKTMRDLAQENQTMIVVTHEMAFAKDAADEIAFMCGGSIVERAPPSQFFSQPQTTRAQAFLRGTSA